MTLPRGKIVYENLNTSFTNFEELLADLKTNQVTGAVHILLWEAEGILLLDNGSIVHAVELSEKSRKLAQDAVKSLLQKVTGKNGTISVYRFPAEVVTLLAETSNSEVIYKNLSSDFTQLEMLLNKLKDESHTGFVEIVTPENKHLATVFIQQGESQDCIVSQNDAVVAEPLDLPQLVARVNQQGAVFNVFKSSLSAKVQKLSIQNENPAILGFWESILSILEKYFEPRAFERLLRQKQIDLAEKYPFLDPFAGEFSYTNRKINLENTSGEDFSRGMVEVVRQIVPQINNPNLRTDLESLEIPQTEGTLGVFSSEWVQQILAL